VKNSVQFGGCLTVNWHDRSLAPERLWEESYLDLLQDLKSQGAWFSTAGQAVSWFRKRRSAVFEMDPSGRDAVRARLSKEKDDHLPSLRLRIHNPRASVGAATQGSEGYVDLPFEEKIATRIACAVSS
jgi:hypothetical protein